MELVKHPVSLREFPNRTVTIIPLGDIQWTGRPNDIALNLLKETIARGVEANALWIGMGDYGDFLSPSNRQRLRSAALYDTAMNVLDDKAESLMDELYEEVLKPTTGRWLGLLHGHHAFEFSSGETSDMYLARKLKARFLGTTAYVGLQVVVRGTSATTINIWATHGSGGGGKPHAPILKLDNILPAWEFDIGLVGHMTKLAAAPVNRVYPVWSGRGAPKLQHKTIYLVGCGGYSKSYIEGARQGQVPMDGYVAQKMMRPTALGSPIIRVRTTRRYKGSSADPRRGTKSQRVGEWMETKISVET